LTEYIDFYWSGINEEVAWHLNPLWYNYTLCHWLQNQLKK
jgi:hypothetical protein